jgi:hypothetical protein
MMGDMRNFVHRSIECLFVRLRRFGKTAQLSNKLERRRANFIIGRRRTEVMKCFDGSTHTRPSTILDRDQLSRDADVLWFGEEFRLRQAAFVSLRRARGYGAAGSTRRKVAYFAIQMFFASVKKCNASIPPSRPTPLAFMPPNGTRRSRTSQQFTQTVPV